MLQNYTSEAIVLRRNNYGEADRILSIYSVNQGRISLIAKGVRKPKSKKRGHIEIFGYIKFSAMKTKGMDMLIEAEVIDDFKSVRSNLKKVALAFYFIEVIAKITHEGEANHTLFELLLNSLKSLRVNNKLKQLRIDFVMNVLVQTGYWPKGKVMVNPDSALEEVIERQMSSQRVGKRMLQ